MNTKHSIKVITKLNRDTKEGLFKWEINRGRMLFLSGIEVLSDNVYTCKVLKKYLRLYRYQSKSYYDEATYEWIEGYRLEFVDSLGNSEWAFPDDRAIYDLYETVRFKTSNIEDFINDFLSDEDKEEADEKPYDF